MTSKTKKALRLDWKIDDKYLLNSELNIWLSGSATEVEKEYRYAQSKFDDVKITHYLKMYNTKKILEQTKDIKSHITKEISKVSEDIKKLVISENISLKRFIQLTGIKIVQILSLYVMLIATFSLIISRLYGFHIIHPIIGIAALISSTGFFFMTKIQETSKQSYNAF